MQAKGDKPVAAVKAAPVAAKSAPASKPVAVAKPVAAVAGAKKPAVGKKAEMKPQFHRVHEHLFSSNKRDFRIGNDLPPKPDLTRFVRWPRYVRLQRQRSILKQRLKVPPAINHFTKTLESNQGMRIICYMCFSFHACVCFI